MTLDQLVVETRKEFPDFVVKAKVNSKLMLLINRFLLILTFGGMKTFMTTYTTTMGNTVYVPSQWALWTEQSKVRILRHERIHMRQAKKYTRLLFSFLYLFVPLPIGYAYFRAKFEMEAYEETIRAAFEQGGVKAVEDSEFRAHIINQFTGPAYLWMMPDRVKMFSWYTKTVAKLESETT